MKFFTDHFFSEDEKAKMLGSSYRTHLEELKRNKQREQEHLLHLSEINFTNYRQQLEQQAFDRNSNRLGRAVLAFVIVATLINGFGISFLLGGI